MDLDGIILTHRHIDHSNDINIMIEAMTNGGFNKKGVIFAPKDAYEEDPVILKYIREHVNKIEILKEKGKYNLGNITFETPIKHLHGVETYGLNLIGEKYKISLISDSKYFDALESYYPGDILIINVVLLKNISQIYHLSIDDAEKILTKNKPKLGILTHFGMTVIKNKPWEIAEKLRLKHNLNIIAANDGMQINIDEYLV